MSKNKPVHLSVQVSPVTDAVGLGVGPLSIIESGVKIGREVTVGAHCLIESGAIVGDFCVIESGVVLPGKVELGVDVQIDANVAFSMKSAVDEFESARNHHVLIDSGAHIGTSAVVYAGVTIGKGACVRAGSIVTESIPPFSIVSGNPAHVIGYVDTQGDGRGSELVDLKVPERKQPGDYVIGVGDATVHRLKYVNDIRGNLSVGEFPGDIPFEPKRYFLIFDVPSKEVRGAHAHRECGQFLICVKGQCSVVLDNGRTRSEVQLTSPDLGVYIPPLVWGTQYQYSQDAVLLVFASHYYDDSDYIRDYQEYLDIVGLT